jgi:hypothetical protein
MSSQRSPSTSGQPSLGRRLTVAAVMAGEPRGPELWTLRRLCGEARDVQVVRARGNAASYRLGNLLGPKREDDISGRRLDELLEAAHIRQWWKASGVTVLEVSQLDGDECQQAVAKVQPDVIVQLSGELLKPNICSLAQLMTVTIRYGQPPTTRARSSISWGILHGRRDWIAATVRSLDSGCGRVFWRGTPQLAPGDSSTEILFRMHLAAVEALIGILDACARGDVPVARVCETVDASVSGVRLGLIPWLQFLFLRRGRKARLLLERGIEC